VGLLQTLNFNISGTGPVAGGQITLAGNNSFTGGVSSGNDGRINIGSLLATAVLQDFTIFSLKTSFYRL
jgi:hypothetical protein